MTCTTCTHCVGVERFFDARVARRELRRYRRKGPAKTTQMLVDALADEGVAGASFLDIGGGIGAVQHALMAAGASGGTSVDASPAYLEAARDEATERGHAERIRYVSGDFMDVQDGIEPADLVALDRVVCCYPDMVGLVESSARRARRVYGLVYPRDRRLMKAFVWALNLGQRLRRHPFRVFVHASADVEARVEAQGLSKAMHARTFLWQVVIFTRPPAARSAVPAVQ